MNKKGIVITLIGLVVVISIFGYSRYQENKINNINLDNIVSTYKDNNYTAIYTGTLTDSVKDTLHSWYKKYLIKGYTINISKDDLNDYLKTYNTSVDSDTPVYLLFDKSGFLGLFDSSISSDKYDEQVRKYLYNEIPQDEIKYKTISPESYIKKVNSKNLTVAVIGEDSCTYCNMIKPVINRVAEEKKLDIYYFNLTTMDNNDQVTLEDLNFTIPAKCTTQGEDRLMSEGYAKPMTLITKNGKLVDCIKGYYDYDTYVSKLKEAKVLE